MFDLAVISEQNEWSDFWQQFQMLFDLTKNDYLCNLKKTEQDQITAIANKYADTRQSLDVPEATIAKDLILKIMSSSGFFDVIRNSEDDDWK